MAMLAWIVGVCLWGAAFPTSCEQDVSRFSRVLSSSYKKYVDLSAVVFTSISRNQCARNCHEGAGNSTCLSFTHKGNDGMCELHSKIYMAPLGTDVEPNNVYFVKTSGDDVCGWPVLDNGSVLSTTGFHVGARAKLSCHDYYYLTVDGSLCTATGSWSNFVGACAPFPDPFTIPTGNKIDPGECMSIVGTPIRKGNIALRLLGPNSQDQYLSIGVRFGEEAIVRDAVVGDSWGSQERSLPYWPFVVNQEFNFTVCAEAVRYRIEVDGVFMFYFNYRFPATDVSYFEAVNDVVIRQIVFV